MSGAITITRVLLVLMMTSSCASLWPFGGGKSEGSATAEKSTAATAEKPIGARAEKSTAATADKPIAAPESKYNDRTASMGRDDAVPAVTPSKDDDISLKQARLMARMDEIEGELKRQREKVRLLEQGLLTGIAPDDLKPGGAGKKAQKSGGRASRKPPVEDLFAAESPSEDLASPNLDGVDVRSNTTKGSAETGGSSALNTRMQLAKEHYQASRFGLAIAELAGISREFGDKAADGAVRLWLGKSYLGLKEYGTARGEFEAYIKGWPSGEGVASARIDLARVYVGLGLKERARGELRRVIKDFDGQEASEMASMELKNLQGNL
jgi:TolA-binding protein